MVLVATATGSLIVRTVFAQTNTVPVVATGADWVDTLLKVIAVLGSGTGILGVFAKFWGRDRAEGEKSRTELLEDRARTIRRQHGEIDDLRTERDMLREELLEERTKTAHLEAAVLHRVTDNNIG